MNVAKLARIGALAAPLLLAGCDTISDLKIPDPVAWAAQIHINLPWKPHETVAKADPAPEPVAPVQMASEPVSPPEGLQRDDLRKPFGGDSETAVASREGL
jgi:hypothetical protein